MAPEIVQELTYDEKVDSWSVGVIAYILLSGRPPFKGKSKTEIFNSITNSELVFDNQIWNMISADAKDFITKALIKDKDDRYDTKMLLDHVWLYKQVKEPEVGERAQLDIFNNLKEFRDISIFQSGVLSFIVNLQATSEELEELKNLFIQLDKSKDGTLSLDEIRDGMDLVLGKLPGTKAKYDDLMKSLDKDGNGVIDYTEFITGAIDKSVMLSKKNL